MTATPGGSQTIGPRFATLLGVLAARGWNPAELDEIRHFLDHDEPGVALETLAGIAVEERKALPPELLADIAALAAAMRLSASPALLRLHDATAEPARASGGPRSAAGGQA